MWLATRFRPISPKCPTSSWQVLPVPVNRSASTALSPVLLLQNSPNELRFVMVDPKRVELTGYNGIPHLAAPVVVEMDRVVGTLQWALREMDSRYQTFATMGARNINQLQQKSGERWQGQESLTSSSLLTN